MSPSHESSGCGDNGEQGRRDPGQWRARWKRANRSSGLLREITRIADVAQAVLWILFEAAAEEVPDLRWRFLQIGLFMDHGGEGFRRILALKEALAGQQFVQHDAPGPDIGALVDNLAPRLLRAHVRSGSQ